MLSGISGSLPCSGNSSYCWWNLKRNDSAFVHRQLIDFHKRQPLIFSIHMNRYYLSTFQSKSASPPLHEIIPYFSDSSNGTIVNVFPIDTSSFKMVDNWGYVFRFPFSQSQSPYLLSYSSTHYSSSLLSLKSSINLFTFSISRFGVFCMLFIKWLNKINEFLSHAKNKILSLNRRNSHNSPSSCFAYGSLAAVPYTISIPIYWSILLYFILASLLFTDFSSNLSRYFLTACGYLRRAARGCRTDRIFFYQLLVLF